jgi:thymidine phosphorylase
LLVQTRKQKKLWAARHVAELCLASGAPRRKWDEMIVAQGADLAAFNRKLKRDHTAPTVVEMKARRSGKLTKCDARIIGEVVRDMGGGRLTKESVIQYDVGIDQLAQPGERISTGGVLVRVHARNPAEARQAISRLQAAFVVS